MQKKILWIGLVLVLTSSLQVKAQYFKEDSTFRKHFIGSTLFMLGNLAPKNRPDFVQLNYGYRITGRDVISLELKTWKYAWPLGTPYGKSFQAQTKNFQVIFVNMVLHWLINDFFGKVFMQEFT